MKKTITAGFLGFSILTGCVSHNTQNQPGNGNTASSEANSGNASGNKGSISSGTSSTGDNSPVANHKDGSTGANLSGLPISK